MAKNRDERGYFAKGNTIATGRPCAPYSLTHAMRVAKSALLEGAADTESVFGDANDPKHKITREQCAALWLTHVAATGQDRRADSISEVAFRDRLAAIQAIWQQCEPVKDQGAADEAAQRAAQDARMAILDDLSDEELALADKLARRAMAERN